MAANDEQLMSTAMTRREWLILVALSNQAGISLARTLSSSRQTDHGAAALGSSHRALFGAAIELQPFRTEPDYRAAFARRCEICTIAGPLYWKYVEPQPGEFSFSDADELLAFASVNRIAARGHTLVWHSMLPGWAQGTMSMRGAEQILVRHISHVVSHFQGKMHSWDVLNEIAAPTATGLRDTGWIRALGDRYIPIAFQTARDADPKALLGYNEYGLEGDSITAWRKRRFVLSLLESWKRSGVQIDYLGLQGHLSATERFSEEGLGAFLRDVEGLGLRVLVTELDVDDRDLPADITVRDRAIAAVYTRFLDVVVASPIVDAVITWGFSDRRTWLATADPRRDRLPQRPLPFDTNLRPKPAWHAIARELGIADTL